MELGFELKQLDSRLQRVGPVLCHSFPSVSVKLPMLLMHMDSFLGIQRGAILHQDREGK